MKRKGKVHRARLRLAVPTVVPPQLAHLLLRDLEGAEALRYLELGSWGTTACHEKQGIFVVINGAFEHSKHIVFTRPL